MRVDDEGGRGTNGLVCKYTCTCTASEQGESGHISDLNILPSLINLVDIPALRCMSKQNHKDVVWLSDQHVHLSSVRGCQNLVFTRLNRLHPFHHKVAGF